jgi:WD40 repeat protein
MGSQFENMGPGERALSTSWDHTIEIWDVNTHKFELTLVGHQGSVLGAAAYADDIRLISASADHTMKIWGLRNGGIPTNTLASHGGSVTEVATFAGGTRAISASEDKP